ncbi:DUF5317 domain-containing protein [Acidaminobacter hydrogenoformans]|uniref:Uncharacterized protein n=1 Tax=Acidaminobacter hydrogenoformans DSM 2784 TaxID=1120920 RepID=A0A1G5S486_9FIRM|nr:DUF5317 domain-containing protein [Acidaminobacter hydrogenoformans]SCZ80551.1 hypothetical protein SAMN03080599_02323 [Acidaminobacter hydrogenoformans DSM 2784]
MFIEALAIGLIAGIVRNGRVRNLLDLEIAGVSLIITAVILQISPIVLEPFIKSENWLAFFPFVGTLVMIAAVLMNRKNKGFYIILIGALLNALAMGLSGFRMPVTETALMRAGMQSLLETIQDGSVINYVLVTSADGLAYYLGKVIAIPEIYPLSKLFSVGDLLISAGLAYFIQNTMLNQWFRKSGSMINYRF